RPDPLKIKSLKAIGKNQAFYRASLNKYSFASVDAKLEPKTWDGEKAVNNERSTAFAVCAFIIFLGCFMRSFFVISYIL
ncbi:hypothetical protein AALA73_12125, partial [Parasutterella excrementihominis]|uniref:hypothetical protein n=1 Tax=Parasutterella excrementihominis TaxID=487175 RepID=UPI00351649EB